MDKAFLFDTSSKIYIATDSAPLENQVYVICSDYIDLVGDLSLLYECALFSSPLARQRLPLFSADSISPHPPLQTIVDPPNPPSAQRVLRIPLRHALSASPTPADNFPLDLHVGELDADGCVGAAAGSGAGAGGEAAEERGEAWDGRVDRAVGG